MPELDLSLTITSIIAICALASPIITTLINNHHQKSIRKMDYVESEKTKQLEQKRDVFENYLQYAGAFVHRFDLESLKDFGMYSARALCYVPEDMLDDMKKLEILILNRDQKEAIILLEQISIRLRPILREL